MDERSPWLLFDDPEAVRERVTRRFYRCAYDLRRDDADFEPAERVQAFIDAEHAETTYDKRYHGAYDGRFIAPGAVEALMGEVQRDPWKPDVLSRNYQRLFGPEFKERTREYLLLYEERETLLRVQADARQGKVESFLFRDRTYRPASLKRLTKKVEEQYREEQRWLAARDRMVFLIHYQMARDVGRATADELASRYRFHLKLQQILSNLIDQQISLQAVLTFLNNTRPPLPSSVFQEVRNRLRKAHEVLDLCLRSAFQLRLPRLENMTEGAPLSDFLLPRMLIKGLRPTASVLTVKWINKFLRQMSEVREKVRRIHFKSLGAILALQEQIAQKWTTELADVPEVVEAEEEVLTAEEETKALAARNAALAETDAEAEIELSEADVMEGETATSVRPEIELEELDPGPSNQTTRRGKG